MPFEILQSPEIWHRNDFPLLCMWRQLTRCLEIGVDKGCWSEVFLSRAWGLELYVGVDHYQHYEEMSWNRDADYISAAIKYERFGDVAKLVKASSIEAVHMLQQSSLLYSSVYDFIYVDAKHDEKDVYEDLKTWWPFVSQKGIIAGHDWRMLSGDHPGVRKAVTRFAAEQNKAIYYTYTDDPQSWYIYKANKPTDIDFRRAP